MEMHATNLNTSLSLCHPAADDLRQNRTRRSLLECIDYRKPPIYKPPFSSLLTG